MKPLKLKFGAFGPYTGVQEIDFEDFAGKGLFLICGETGSGKTMILDAMTFALYGKSSGNMRDELEALRCRESDWGQDTFVDFTFTTGGREYRFERRLECKRKKLSQVQNVYIKNEGGIFEPVFENCKKNDMDVMARELLGLDYDQFRQVIILPQGQFEKLLVSGSDEKEKILMSIFGVDKWQKLAEHFYRHAEERLSELKRLRERMINSLAEEECSTLQELEEQVEQINIRLEQEQAEYTEWGYEKRRSALEQEKELCAAFDRLRKLQMQRGRLEEGAKEQSRRGERKILAEKAEVLRPMLERLKVLGEEVNRREKQAQNCRDGLWAAKDRMDALREQGRQLEEKGHEMEALESEVLLNSSKTEIYQKLEELRIQAKKLGFALKKEEGELLRKKEARQKAEQQVQALRARYEELSARHKVMLTDYVANIAGILAEELQEGTPCPVCGSIHHPAKAQLAEGGISRGMVDEAKEQADAMYEELNRAMNDAQTAGEAVSVSEQNYLLAVERKQTADGELAGAGESLLPGIPDLNALQEWLEQSRRTLQNYKKGFEELTRMTGEAREQELIAASNLENAKRELKAICAEREYMENNLAAGLEQQGFGEVREAAEAMLEPEEMKQLCSMMDRYEAEKELLDRQIQEMSETLGDRQEPDAQACMQGLRELEEVKEDYIGRRQVGLQIRQRKQDKANRLRENYVRLEEQFAGAETDFTFAKNLRGDTGTGLQRYVLGIMFSSVIVAANKMLEQVHDGRYRLYRSDERSKGSNKRGLELKVYDKRSRETEGRSVKTLSGGEKFLVSLALSIGMSTIAQKSGIRIEAMFIDEGFGSLDQNSIEDALGILATVRKSNSLVGIISHVQILQDNIPVKLHVVKAPEGSRIVQSIG